MRRSFPTLTDIEPHAIAITEVGNFTFRLNLDEKASFFRRIIPLRFSPTQTLKQDSSLQYNMHLDCSGLQFLCYLAFFYFFFFPITINHFFSITFPLPIFKKIMLTSISPSKMYLYKNFAITCLHTANFIVSAFYTYLIEPLCSMSSEIFNTIPPKIILELTQSLKCINNSYSLAFWKSNKFEFY